MKPTSLEEFYNVTTALLPEGISREIGHFNVFKVEEMIAHYKAKQSMPYNRREYYKISLINGRNKTEYADKVIDVEKNALLFGTPKVPYNWTPQDDRQGGYFCIFTSEFLIKNKSGAVLDDLPIFRSSIRWRKWPM